MLIVDTCLAVLSPKITENKLQVCQKDTHAHITPTSRPPARVCQTYLMVLNTHTPVWERVSWFSLPLSGNSQTLRQSHADPQTKAGWYTGPRTHLYTRVFPLLENCRFPASGRPDGKNVWTNLRCTHTYACRHTTEHFQPTMLTLYSLAEPLYLRCGQVKQRFSVDHHQAARLGGSWPSVMSMQGWASFRNWTLIQIQIQKLSNYRSESLSFLLCRNFPAMKTL